MITTLLISAIYQLFSIIIAPILPTMDSAIVAKLNSTVSYIISKFLILGTYYLPIDTIKIVISTILGVYIISFGIKFVLKIIPILSGGIVKTDKL